MSNIWRLSTCAKMELKRKAEEKAKQFLLSSSWIHVQAGPSRGKNMEGSSADGELGGSSETVCKNDMRALKNKQQMEEEKKRKAEGKAKQDARNLEADFLKYQDARNSEADFLKDKETRNRQYMEFMLNFESTIHGVHVELPGTGANQGKKLEGSLADANANAVAELSLGGSSETDIINALKREWKNKQMEEEKKRKAEEKANQETRYRQFVDSMLSSKSTRYRQRFLDLMSKAREKITTRAEVDQYIRSFLDNRGFLQVRTPTTNLINGGAASKLFFAYNDDLVRKLYMRIAPALFLQELVVRELASVYAIERPFLNVGIIPEFATCQFYMVLADYYDLMKLTEEMLSGMVKELTGGYKIKYHANGLDNDPIEIDFTPPFRRIEMIEELEKIAKISIPKDIASDEANKYLVEACTKFEINCPPPQTTARLLAKLVGHFLEEMCVNPAFIINHPEIMSPLAKGHRSKPGLTERFELFINKHEVCNAYTVLTDLVVQYQRFDDHLMDQTSGVDYAMPLVETFCNTLGYGLPPTAGWGLSIDRLAMLLTDSQEKEEVLLFPAMNPLDEPQIKGSQE